jgi:hypothetical protein
VRFLVVLDAHSIIGRVYSRGQNDGYVNDGTDRHPVLDCLEVATDSASYLFAKRDMKRHGGGHQSLHIPHSSVVAVHIYADEAPKPFGFTPPEK